MTNTFKAFQASRKHVDDVAATVGFTDGEPPHSGYVYAESCYIEDVQPGSRLAALDPTARYYLMVERSDWLSADLAYLERILWATHYVYETGVMLKGEELDDDLSEFINGYCDANGITVDGDVFGHVFSGIDPDGISPHEAAQIINDAARAFDLHKPRG